MTTRAKAEARKAAVIERNAKAFTMKRDDIPNMVDAVFFGNPKKPGWIEMYVNGKGRESVNI
jgi:hypothetical protein